MLSQLLVIEAGGVGSYFLSRISHIVCLELDELEELIFGLESEITEFIFFWINFDSSFEGGVNNACCDRGSDDL